MSGMSPLHIDVSPHRREYFWGRPEERSFQDELSLALLLGRDGTECLSRGTTLIMSPRNLRWMPRT